MSGRTWTFLTNHAHVLLAAAQDPSARVRDLADRVGITERAAQLILNDLEADGYLERTRVGRRNTYRMGQGLPFRHPLESGRTVDELLRMFTAIDGSPAPAEASTP